MSEIGRERERSDGFFRRDDRNDFRSSLFSVFIDNLNPTVDSSSLWGIFKPHGRLRDVFLCTKNRQRRSAYAFIRFETEEEANRVAKRVDGMHVYCWPIRANLVSLGWNRKRSGVGEGIYNYEASRDYRKQDSFKHRRGRRSFSEDGKRFVTKERGERRKA
ncbi:hypothetical protein Dsin_015025 [Dipteronia sinensis]|uniref:RRM domain-containing protein n=1 Tax=Dipteronia sinensis TaxID=43782 RepID=A0AAE0ANZ7_9ROSI|nr:hypothetical protein Dsin_015025 [Dipteronia sinensis]